MAALAEPEPADSSGGCGSSCAGASPSRTSISVKMAAVLCAAGAATSWVFTVVPTCSLYLLCENKFTLRLEGWRLYNITTHDAWSCVPALMSGILFPWTQGG